MTELADSTTQRRRGVKELRDEGKDEIAEEIYREDAPLVDASKVFAPDDLPVLARSATFLFGLVFAGYYLHHVIFIITGGSLDWSSNRLVQALTELIGAFATFLGAISLQPERSARHANNVWNGLWITSLGLGLFYGLAQFLWGSQQNELFTSFDDKGGASIPPFQTTSIPPDTSRTPLISMPMDGWSLEWIRKQIIMPLLPPIFTLIVSLFNSNFVWQRPIQTPPIEGWIDDDYLATARSLLVVTALTYIFGPLRGYSFFNKVLVRYMPTFASILGPLLLAGSAVPLRAGRGWRSVWFVGLALTTVACMKLLTELWQTVPVYADKMCDGAKCGLVQTGELTEVKWGVFFQILFNIFLAGSSYELVSGQIGHRIRSLFESFERLIVRSTAPALAPPPRR